MPMSNEGGMNMKAFTASAFSYCTNTAAACTSMPVHNNMDTAIPAVSIVIVPLDVEICT